MEFLEFSNILPRVFIMNITENPVPDRFIEIKTGDGGLLHRGYLTGETGIHHVYSTECKTQRIVIVPGVDSLMRFRVLPATQRTPFPLKEKISLRLPVPDRQCGFRTMFQMIVDQFRQIYI